MRRLAVTMLAVMLALALLPSVAWAGHNAQSEDPCEGAPVADEFADYDEARAAHRNSIDCALYRRITTGAGTNENGDPIYRPLREVNRAQMAQFIVNTLVAGGYDDKLLPGDGQDEFDDISGNFARLAINRLARAGIVGGTGDGDYSPGQLVSRQQMATFIVESARVAVGDDHPVESDGNDRFTDVSEGNFHKGNIEAGADAGLFGGTSPTTFDPFEDVLRDQMATFLVSLLKYVYDPEKAPAVDEGEAPTLTIATKTVDAGKRVTGEITGGGVQSATLSGCGFNNEPVEDRNTSKNGIQFSEVIRADQPAAECTLTFAVTVEGGDPVQLTQEITVTEPTGVTVRPELLSAEIVSTTTTEAATPGTPAGTVVRFFFDEPVTGDAPTASDFAVTSFDGARTTGDTTGGDPEVESSTNGRTVLVRFTGINTESGAADLTVASVDDGAVRDDQGAANPEGDAAIGAERTETVRNAGETAAPDLKTVDGFRQGADDGTTAVDFTFDEAAFVVDPSGFMLVLTDSVVVPCEGPARAETRSSGGPQAGGNGTTTITAVCTNPTSGETVRPLNATTVARGYVEAGTVSDTAQTTQTPQDPNEGNVNPLQAADVVAEGETNSPDLVSVELRPGTGSDADEAVYTFDQVIRPLEDDSPVTGEPAALFHLYDTSGKQFSGDSSRRNPDNTRQAIVTFGSTAVDDAVGASLEPGAVTGATGASLPNEADEVGVASNTTLDIKPGETDGPDLVSVRLTPATASSGAAAIYTFDEPVNASQTDEGAAQPRRFLLYLADGTQLTCVGVPETPTFKVGDTDATRNQVTCSQYRTSTGPANSATVLNAVLGTVDFAAVDDREPGLNNNPEGAEPTEGGTGEPEQ